MSKLEGSDMLILARKIGQKIVIGEEISVTIVEVRGDQVRLGINAPRSISVHRQELWDQICEENRRASDVDIELITPQSPLLTAEA